MFLARAYLSITPAPEHPDNSTSLHTSRHLQTSLDVTTEDRWQLATCTVILSTRRLFTDRAISVNSERSSPHIVFLTHSQAVSRNSRNRPRGLFLFSHLCRQRLWLPQACMQPKEESYFLLPLWLSLTLSDTTGVQVVRSLNVKSPYSVLLL